MIHRVQQMEVCLNERATSLTFQLGGSGKGTLASAAAPLTMTGRQVSGSRLAIRQSWFIASPVAIGSMWFARWAISKGVRGWPARLQTAGQLLHLFGWHSGCSVKRAGSQTLQSRCICFGGAR